jgi:DnaK suppressor protein
MKKTAAKETGKGAKGAAQPRPTTAKSAPARAAAAARPAAKAAPAPKTESSRSAPPPKPQAKSAPAPVASKNAKREEAPSPKPAAKAPPRREEAPVAEKTKQKSAGEEPTRVRMNKTELKYFENLLNEKKETLLQELGYLEDNTMRLSSKEGAGDLSSHAYHLADHATETQDREQAFHMASREGKYLFYIEEALDRVRNGTFGICKKCGKLIPKARLEAVPTAKMCIECKSAQERASEAASNPG